MKQFFDEDDLMWEQKLKDEPIAEDTEVPFGCGFCWDKRKNKSKELFFLDNANNMRECLFCPYCGRKYEEDSRG